MSNNQLSHGMNEKPASQLRFKTCRLGRHDLVLIRHTHNVNHRHRAKYKSDPRRSYIHRIQQGRERRITTDKVQAGVIPHVKNIKGRRENLPLQKRRVKHGYNGITSLTFLKTLRLRLKHNVIPVLIDMHVDSPSLWWRMRWGSGHRCDVCDFAKAGEEIDRGLIAQRANDAIV